MKSRREPLYAAILLFCVFVLYFSLFYLHGKEYYLVSLVIILSGIILFMLNFENRKPSVAELTIIAVMCALAVVSRVSFFFCRRLSQLLQLSLLQVFLLGRRPGLSQVR